MTMLYESQKCQYFIISYIKRGGNRSILEKMEDSRAKFEGLLNTNNVASLSIYQINLRRYFPATITFHEFEFSNCLLLAHHWQCYIGIHFAKVCPFCL